MWRGTFEVALTADGVYIEIEGVTRRVKWEAGCLIADAHFDSRVTTGIYRNCVPMARLADA